MSPPKDAALRRSGKRHLVTSGSEHQPKGRTRTEDWSMLGAVATQTMDAVPSAADLSSRAVNSYRGLLWAGLLSYPFVPALLSASAGLATSGQAWGVAGVLLSYGWSISAPVAAWFALGAADRVKLNRREHPQVAREAVFAAIAAP